MKTSWVRSSTSSSAAARRYRRTAGARPRYIASNAHGSDRRAASRTPGKSSVQLTEEAEQRRVHLLGPLLLGPVPRAFDEHLAPEVGHESIHVVDQRAVGDDGVAVAGDEQRGL